MSDLQEPNPNISALASLYPEGKYPSHIDIFGKGGFVSLNDEIGLSGYDDFINERIRFLRRKSGMLVYINSDESFHRCLTAGSGETDGQWKREYFTGRYFHGPAAPTADDLQVGERWFDTVVGTEYTYIPIAEGSTYLEWVDLDHLGAGRKYFYGLTAPEAGTDGDPLNIGDKWFNSTVGSEFTYLPTDGTLTGNKQWIDIDSPGSDDILDIWVNESGDTMTGTLTGTDIYLSGSLTTDKGFRESGDPEFQNNEFITKQYGEDIYVNESGDTMTGTLTGTDISLTGSLSAAGPIFVSKGFRRSVDPEFQDNEFITKLYGEDNFGSGDFTIVEDVEYDGTSTGYGTGGLGYRQLEPKKFRTLRHFKMRNDDGTFSTFQFDDMLFDFSDPAWPSTPWVTRFDSGNIRWGSYVFGSYLAPGTIGGIELLNTNQIPNFGWLKVNVNSGLGTGYYTVGRPGGTYRTGGDEQFPYTVPSNTIWGFLNTPQVIQDPNNTNNWISGYNLKGVIINVQIMTYSDPQ